MRRALVTSENDGKSGDPRLAPVALLLAAGNIVSAVLVDRARVEEVLVQMVDEFEDVAIHGPGHGDVVDQAVVGRAGGFARVADSQVDVRTCHEHLHRKRRDGP